MVKNVLESPAVEKLTIDIEQNMRSTKDIRRFIEPSQGTLQRAVSKQHHVIFGRRGSVKSSLLRKAASDLTIDRRPIAYIDLEVFKGHSYPDVLLSVLIKTFSEFEEWLTTAAINPATKTSFWNKYFDTHPSRAAFNREDAIILAQTLHIHIDLLTSQLHSADDIDTHRIIRNEHEVTGQTELGLQVGLNKINVSGKLSDSHKVNGSQELDEAYRRSKTDYLHTHILEFQGLFDRMNQLSDGDSYLFLDDLYHIRRVDQARLIDYFHRLAKGHNLWLKIGTIRHRTQWYINGDPPVGIKLGDDAEDIDLDLTLEKYTITKQFLIRILNKFIDDTQEVTRQDLLVDDAVDRLILASGGVARDFLGIFRRSVTVARERIMSHGTAQRGPRIAIEDVNGAAGDYDTSKRQELIRDATDDQTKLEGMFQKLVSYYVDDLNTNVFLIDQKAHGGWVDLIQELVDLRLLHKIRSHVTVKSGHPRQIFEAYMIDISQYTGARMKYGLDDIKFWRPDSDDSLRKSSLIYDPEEIKIKDKKIIKIPNANMSPTLWDETWPSES
ncbi:hypothetical protein ccbrp13_13530 [Ktedonobacteria bacterium brp13]|nr:hypothetical protein ccbrp13_13530 [Ktedonobacteria bacterium brp13]